MKCSRLIYFVSLLHLTKCHLPEELKNNKVPLRESFGDVVLEAINSVSWIFKYSLESAVTTVAKAFRELEDQKYNPRNCFEVQQMGDSESGVKSVYPYKDYPNWRVNAFCDQDTDDGGWTVFQARQNLPIREKFYRKWIEYVRGFGHLNGEYWLGLNDIHALCDNTLMEMRVDLEDSIGEKRFAKYDFFFIESAKENYRLNIGGYTGSAGDSLINYHNNKMFTTHDRDNDNSLSGNCAELYKGGWWYGSCHASNLNGHHFVGNHTSYADGINWTSFRGHHNSMKITSMKLRPALK